MAPASSSNHQRLDPGALRATRRALGYVLRSETESAGEAPDLSEVNMADFVRAVRRHRVSIVLSPHAAELGLDSPTCDALRSDSHRQRLTAMALAADTSEAVAALTAAGIRVIALKGVALAVQTTGDLTARGSGDIDIWVDPSEMAGAVRRLGEIGFAQQAGSCPAPDDSWQWRYVRWSYCELGLRRGNTAVDLHWSGTGPRSTMPDFDAAWAGRETVSIGGQTVATLGVDDAAAHTCMHAYADQWRWLRSVVDIARLSRMTDLQRSPQLINSLSITLSADVTRDCLGQTATSWPTASPKPRQRAIATSWNAQLEVDRVIHGKWRPQIWWAWHRHALLPATELADYARRFASTALPASTFVDADSGKTLSASKVLAKRARLLASRLRRPPMSQP